MVHCAMYFYGSVIFFLYISKTPDTVKGAHFEAKLHILFQKFTDKNIRNPLKSFSLYGFGKKELTRKKNESHNNKLRCPINEVIKSY
jgi:hypothetical protein